MFALIRYILLHKFSIVLCLIAFNLFERHVFPIIIEQDTQKCILCRQMTQRLLRHLF